MQKPMQNSNSIPTVPEAVTQTGSQTAPEAALEAAPKAVTQVGSQAASEAAPIIVPLQLPILQTPTLQIPPLNSLSLRPSGGRVVRAESKQNRFAKVVEFGRNMALKNEELTVQNNELKTNVAVMEASLPLAQQLAAANATIEALRQQLTDARKKIELLETEQRTQLVTIGGQQAMLGCEMPPSMQSHKSSRGPCRYGSACHNKNSGCHFDHPL